MQIGYAVAIGLALVVFVAMANYHIEMDQIANVIAGRGAFLERQNSAWPAILEMSMEEQAKYVEISYHNDVEAIYNEYYMGHDGVYFFDGDNLSTHMHVLSGIHGEHATTLIGDMAYLLVNMRDGDSVTKFKYEKGITKRELVTRDFNTILYVLRSQENTDKKMRATKSL